MELDEIIADFNRTLTRFQPREQGYNIDFNNPVHYNVDMDYPWKYYSTYDDYINFTY